MRNAKWISFTAILAMSGASAAQRVEPQRACRSEFDPVPQYTTPVVVWRTPQGHRVPLAENAVLAAVAAEAAVPIYKPRQEIELPDRFSYVARQEALFTYPTIFDGRIIYCISDNDSQTRLGAYSKSDNSSFVTSICLSDEMSERKFSKMTGYFGESFQLKIFETLLQEPIELAPVSDFVRNDDDSWITKAGRRIRAENLTPTSVVLRDEITRFLADGRQNQQWVGEAFRTTLQLKEGSSARLGGLTVRAISSNTGWEIESSGEFSRWIALDCEGTMVRISLSTFDRTNAD